MRQLVGIAVALAVYVLWRAVKAYIVRWMQRDILALSEEFGVPVEYMAYDEHYRFIDVRDGTVLEVDDGIV